MKNKIIYPGDEILFAYHADYWKRWGMTRKRGRPPNHGTDTQEPRKTAKPTSARAPTHTGNTPAEPHMPTTDETQGADVRGQRETQTDNAYIYCRYQSC